jgi:hypothetical protein
VPWQAKEMIYPVADLEYVSAVRLRVLDTRDALETRKADKGVLSSDDQVLLDLCNRMHDKLIAPTERAALDSNDPAVLAALASVLVATGDGPDKNLVFEGDAKELTLLIEDIRAHAIVLRLPVVVPGGRVRLGVTYLLTVTLLGYLAVLLTAMSVIVLTVPRASRLGALRGLAFFWCLAAVFAVCWFVMG